MKKVGEGRKKCFKMNVVGCDVAAQEEIAF
jgi:hypothetical protein